MHRAQERRRAAIFKDADALKCEWRVRARLCCAGGRQRTHGSAPALSGSLQGPLAEAVDIYERVASNYGQLGVLPSDVFWSWLDKGNGLWTGLLTAALPPRTASAVARLEVEKAALQEKCTALEEAAKLQADIADQERAVQREVSWERERLVGSVCMQPAASQVAQSKRQQ